MPRTLITGATGFIGCRLAELWHAEGRDVVATGLVRSDLEEQRATGLQRAGVPLIVADLVAAGKIGEACRDADTIVHLAAAQHEAHVGDDYFLGVNVDATRELLNLAAAQGIERVFYASSIGVYGANDEGTTETIIDEDTPLAPDNAYGRSKAAAEAMIQSWQREHPGGLEVFIGRIGEVYGPWDMRLHKLFAGIEKERFWLVGPCHNLHQPIYVDDLGLAIERLLDTPEAAGRPVILGGDRAITTREMCETIAVSVGRTLSRWSVPMWPLMAAAAGMESTLGRAGIQPPLHRRRLDFFRKSLELSTARRQRLLALPPQRSFEEGARATAEWYRENGWLPRTTALQAAV